MEHPSHRSEPAISPVPPEAVPIASPQRERELAHRHEPAAPVAHAEVTTAQVSEPRRVEPPRIVEPPRVEPPPHVEPPRIELPSVSLTLPAGSDLVMVETTHHDVQAEPQAEPPRQRRVRPPRVEAASEPLEMVETRNDTAPSA